MKSDRSGRDRDRDLYMQIGDDYADDRYWGIFRCVEPEGVPNCGIKIDMRRFRKTVGDKYCPSEEETARINARHTHYFYPARQYHRDYSCNEFSSTIGGLKGDWESKFLPVIRQELAKVPKPELKTPAEYDAVLYGISSPEAAERGAFIEHAFAQAKYEKSLDFIVQCFYAQFFHYMTSSVEAATVRVLAKHDEMPEKDHFNRNVMYGYSGKDESVRGLPHFAVHDRTYCIWNFLKHNSLSTYKKLEETYPKTLRRKNYCQGAPAFDYVAFSEQMIDETLRGLGDFFAEYCELKYKENFREAQWNYAGRYIAMMDEAREEIYNPLGLPWWDNDGGD